jgi:glycosyltransferase involved in cell wall biosynthesis
MANPSDSDSLFFTSIIPTVGRIVLARAVHSVLEQGFSHADYEISVVNDSGSPLPDAQWQHSPRVKIVNTDHVERCVARNVGAAMARGQYLHFLDDDDWLLPGALDTFWRLSGRYEGHPWLFGGTMLFDRDDQPVIRLVHRLKPNCFVQVMAGEWIPLQSSFINRSAFHRVGGFNPLIAGIEDADLIRRMALHFDFQGTDELVAAVGMGTAGSTTNQTRARLDGRRARELVLDEPNAYRRFWESAERGYWQGRIIRIYLTSAAWNMLHRKFFTAISRLIYAIMAVLRSTVHSLFRRDFWRALSGPYQSEAFARGFAEKQEVNRRK